MGYRNRYLFLKRTYPKTIILFYKDNKYKGYSFDHDFLEFLHFNNLNTLNKLKINYLVIQNMNMIEYKIFPHNMYNVYYKRYKLVEFVKTIHSRIS